VVMCQNAFSLRDSREARGELSSQGKLVRFGKAARSLCRDPKCPDTFKRQLQEAREEWRRRHPKSQ